MNTPAVDQKLDQVALAQLGFKPGPMREVGAAVAKAFDQSSTGFVWSDEVPLPELAKEDKNTVGSVWRLLAKWGVVRRLEGSSDHRRSKAKGRRGGVVWRYELTSQKLLHAFMRANQVERKLTQPNLI